MTDADADASPDAAPSATTLLGPGEPDAEAGDAARAATPVVDLGDGALVARTNDVGEPAYEEKQQVLDDMVASLQLVEPDGAG